MGDSISRQGAIKALYNYWSGCSFDGDGYDIADKSEDVLSELPSAEPEIKPISYQDCSNAMLMMWMDNVITDGEYNRIMDKLNAKHMAERRTE